MPINWEKDEYFTGLGLMSGTSVDGLDIAAVRFRETDSMITYEILAAETIPYTDVWSKRLLGASTLSGNDLLHLDADWSRFASEQCNAFVKKTTSEPLFIASHGHTVFHQPESGFSFQIGSGAAIAALTGITTVCDFRRSDVAIGGQGAPLVPIGDELLFPQFAYCLNLGGFANVSQKLNGKRIAYDICSLNIVLNAIARRCGVAFDKGGEMARNSQVNQILLEKLDAHPFYQLKGPKSLGIEWVNSEITPLIESFDNLTPQQLLSTFTEHAAKQIGIAMSNPGKALVTGGGVWNSFLLERIQHHSTAELIIPESTLVEFKEALIFCLLGYLRLQERQNVLPEVTGASRAISSGGVYLG